MHCRLVSARVHREHRALEVGDLISRAARGKLERERPLRAGVGVIAHSRDRVGGACEILVDLVLRALVGRADRFGRAGLIDLDLTSRLALDSALKTAFVFAGARGRLRRRRGAGLRADRIRLVRVALVRERLCDA